MTAPSSFFFKSSAAEHGGGAIAGMAMARIHSQWLLMCRPEWWWAAGQPTVKETKIFFCVLAYPLASRDPSVCCAEMCLALHLCCYTGLLVMNCGGRCAFAWSYSLLPQEVD